MRRLSLAVVATLTLSLGFASEAQKKDVDIKGPDGIVLKGSYALRQIEFQ